jgi:hypothetical protein
MNHDLLEIQFNGEASKTNRKVSDFGHKSADKFLMDSNKEKHFCERDGENKTFSRQFRLNQSTMAIIHGELNGKVHIKWIIKEHKFPSRHFLLDASSRKNCN